MELHTQGARIRALFENAAQEVAVIAPFIKVDALRSLMEVIPAEAHLRCVSRWLPSDIAVGVTDPEILDLLETRGNFSLSLVERLHAKLYIAGERCLVGSTNVTRAGLGEEGNKSNIEALVETTIDDPGIAATLAAIAQAERPATRSMAKIARRVADSLADSFNTTVALGAGWFPRSRSPERAYKLYAQPSHGFVRAADQILLVDLTRSDIPSGLAEKEFRNRIRSLLASIPPAETILEASRDMTLTRADATAWLNMMSGADFSPNDLWIAFVNWMAYFCNDRVMKQEIAEIGLRRAQLLG